LEREKGIDTAIEAARYLPEEVTIEVFGTGAEGPHLERLAAERVDGASVRLLGWAAEPVQHLERWSALLIPSRSEGLPLVIAEAAWSRCPVVATTVGGIPEVAARAGGIRLVPPEDPRALAQAIREVLGDPRPTAPDPRAFAWESFRTRVGEALAAAGDDSGCTAPSVSPSHRRV
jgi:glycosyltransferase involved in cell wall biosynthesis